MDEMYHQFVGVLIVLAILITALWFAKRRGLARWSSLRAGGGEAMVTVLQRVHLTPQHTLHVLAVGGRRLLLTSSPGSCQLISEVPADANAGLGGVTAGKDLR